VLSYTTPVGPLTLAASAVGLTRVTFRTLRRSSAPPSPAALTWLELARHELDAYFAGTLRTFTVPVDMGQVDSANRSVLRALSAVAYGDTTTYGALAATVGLIDDGPRQVGVAMARNPVLIVVPCHRVVGAGGKLTGYAGGVAAKRWLLDLEADDRALRLDLDLRTPTGLG
jgi:methylated-DNA-[protein]-cysteine S-methyltransferase